MVINSQTKIADIIKANPNAIDTIAEINKHFRKLKNPILRRTLARRVTIQDAARIGGVAVDVFFEKLKKIGFEIGVENSDYSTKQEQKQMNILTGSEEIVELDVRDNIASGNDPFQIIMAAIKQLPANGVLKIINTFEPIPLIGVLSKKGYESMVERPEEGVVITYFKKGESIPQSVDSEVSEGEADDLESKFKTYAGRIKTIDVRHLEMPEPMVTILRELEELPEGHALFVHHKKVPKFLLPEIKERGYKYLQKRIDDHNIDFLFYKE